MLPLQSLQFADILQDVNRTAAFLGTQLGAAYRDPLRLWGCTTIFEFAEAGLAKLKQVTKPGRQPGLASRAQQSPGFRIGQRNLSAALSHQHPARQPLQDAVQML